MLFIAFGENCCPKQASSIGKCGFPGLLPNQRIGANDDGHPILLNARGGACGHYREHIGLDREAHGNVPKTLCIRAGARFANKRLELVGRYAPPHAGSRAKK
jgi:hypothetical protein